MSAPQYPQQPQQPYYQPQQPFPPPPPAKKGIPVWGWLLIAFFTLAFLVVIGASVLTYFLVKKAETVAKNPLSAIVQLAAAANPDIDVLDVNENTGKITVRDKKTGKTIVIDSDNIKDGKIVIDSDDGHAVIGAGANVKAPSWIYLPPEAKIAGGMTANTPNGDTGTVVFTSNIPIAGLKAFFEDKYKSDGFDTSLATVSTTNGEEALNLVFRHEGRKRNVTIVAAKSADGTGGTITFAEGQ